MRNNPRYPRSRFLKSDDGGRGPWSLLQSLAAFSTTITWMYAGGEKRCGVFPCVLAVNDEQQIKAGKNMWK